MFYVKAKLRLVSFQKAVLLDFLLIMILYLFYCPYNKCGKLNGPQVTGIVYIQQHAISQLPEVYTNLLFIILATKQEEIKIKIISRL